MKISRFEDIEAWKEARLLTNKEFIQYLVVSRGSAAEVKSFLYTANDIGYITQDKFQQLYSRCTKISNLLNGFIRYLRNTPRKH